ncbi:MAG TPA: tetratricopeptide repeat protein [Chloroflexi bacterium]|nr:tetratricopeptide repeat protein [Chloroflexota bacterium]
MMTTAFLSASLRRLPRQAFIRFMAVLIVTTGAISVRSLSDVFRIAPPTPRTTALTPGSSEAIAQIQARLQRAPTDANSYAQLGIAWLQKIRLTGDTSLYGRAQGAIERSLALDPQNADALTARGVLALALHDFAGALKWADRLLAENPYRAAAYGIRTDALVELGRYDEAVTALQKMVDMRPDTESYSRVSYLRELHGDVDGALAAMQMAVASAAPGTEPWLWALTHLGNLYRSQNALGQAESVYRQVLALQPDYAPALAGLAQVMAAQNNPQGAFTQLIPLAERLPLPEHLILLGELYAAQGDVANAQAQYDLVRVVQQLSATAGMAVDLEMATFEAVHGHNTSEALAQAEAAYATRPTIYAADTLSWSLYRNGRYTEAWHYSEEARRLGTHDALFYLHAAEIAAARGDLVIASEQLAQALAINPYPSPLGNQQLEALKTRLQGGKP